MQRARSQSQKRERKDAILSEAETLFSESGFHDFRMQALANRVGLSKSSLYGYFATKEEVLGTLLGHLFSEWFLALIESVRGKDKWTAKALATIAADSVKGREVLVHLLSGLETILEHNVSPEFVYQIRSTNLTNLQKLADVISQRWPALKKNDGVNFLLSVRAIIIGVRQITYTSDVAQSVLAAPELSPMRLDFDKHLKSTLIVFFEGHEALS